MFITPPKSKQIRISYRICKHTYTHSSIIILFNYYISKKNIILFILSFSLFLGLFFCKEWTQCGAFLSMLSVSEILSLPEKNNRLEFVISSFYIGELVN